MALKVLLTIMMAIPIILIGAYLLENLMTEIINENKKAEKKKRMARRRDNGVELRRAYDYRRKSSGPRSGGTRRR